MIGNSQAALMPLSMGWDILCFVDNTIDKIKKNIKTSPPDDPPTIKKGGGGSGRTVHCVILFYSGIMGNSTPLDFVTQETSTLDEAVMLAQMRVNEVKQAPMLVMHRINHYDNNDNLINQEQYGMGRIEVNGNPQVLISKGLACMQYWRDKKAKEAKVKEPEAVKEPEVIKKREGVWQTCSRWLKRDDK